MWAPWQTWDSSLNITRHSDLNWRMELKWNVCTELHYPTFCAGWNWASYSCWRFHACPQGAGIAAEGSGKVSFCLARVFGGWSTRPCPWHVFCFGQRGARQEHQRRRGCGHGSSVPGSCPQQGFQGENLPDPRCYRLPYSGQCCSQCCLHRVLQYCGLTATLFFLVL